MKRPIVLTCGDPAGVGPEVAAKAWAQLRQAAPFVYIGDPRHLPPDTPHEVISTLDQVSEVCGTALPVLVHRFSAKTVLGAPNPDNAHDIIDVIKTAVSLVQEGKASALCTAPISKKILIEGAGFKYPGHTEFLAALAKSDKPAVMMLACDELRVVPTTIHIPLHRVQEMLTPTLLRDTVRIAQDALRIDFGIAEPRIAIAGLNPHAGEGGTMGRDEQEMIIPLIEELRSHGMNIMGPLPADTMFHPAARQKYDVAICMYHDQALIPIKTIDFAGGVNVTLGLPFVRTSPDHGTAFDIAGKGLADPSSMIAALKMSVQMSENRAKQNGLT